MSTAKEKYRIFKEQYQAARKQMTDTAQSAFKEFTADFFEQFPGVKKFGWIQYTPYFNDGDTCEFSVQNDYDSIKINGVSYYDRDEQEELELGPCTKCDAELEEGDKFCSQCGTIVPTPVNEALTEKEITDAAKHAAEMLGNFDEDIMRDLYGDHVQVTIHRDGSADVDQYDHE
jgi:hypothetical protein